MKSPQIFGSQKTGAGQAHEEHMTNLRHLISPGLVFNLVCVFFTVSLNAAVTYEFRVTEQPADNLHKPFAAALRLSDAAVTSGQAGHADIESLVITGGTVVRDENPLMLSHVHPAFTNWTVTLSGDRNTVTAIAAMITPQNSPIDHLLLCQESPYHPTLDVHENLGYVGTDYIRLETTLLPVPPETRTSIFRGEWERAPLNGFFLFIAHLLKRLTCFPFCPLPWAIIIGTILPALAVRIYRNRSKLK